METKKKQFKMPHTFVIIGIIILLAVLLTWIIPAGSYTRFENEAGIKVIDPNDFNYIDKTPVNPLEIPLYIVKAFIKRIDLMLVIMFAGGAFHILTKTGALHAVVAKMAKIFSTRVYLFLPILTLVFGLICTTQGVNLFIAFAPIMVMMAFAMGLDSITGASIILLGGAIGFSTGPLNINTTIVAQKIAGLPLYSGVGYRFICFAVFYVITNIYLIRYALKIQKHPELSPMYELDKTSEFRDAADLDSFGKLDARKILIMLVFFASLILIVYGGKSAVRSGVLDRAEKSLAEAGISSWTLGGVVPNPHLDKVYEGIRIGKENSIDFLLAVGGGSVIDTAKAIAYGLAEPEKDVWELYEHTRTARKCLPVASILTIAAAGSETSNSSVITRVDTHQKRAYNDDISRPKFALMDPELTKTLPDYQTESGCADIMMHTMERYFTNGGNMELTDALAEGLLRTVMKNAVILHTDPANYEARAEVMWAGSLSHNGLTGCGIASGDFMSHKLEHEMGGMFDVTHGAGLAALWPSWARYVYKDCLPRFVRFARNVMGVTTDGTDEEIALKGIEAMVDFYHSIGMPASFHELGIDPTDAQIDEMARRCLEACGSALGSAKKLSLDDMIAIYRAANH